MLGECTNLANLMLARSITPRHELAVRSSLGAGRDQLVGQLLTESLLLAGLGGILGIVLAVLTLPLMARLVPESLPVSGDLALDGRMLLFAAIATMVTGIGFGAWPAFRAGNTSAAERLRASSRGAMGGRGENLRRALVIVEVTTAVVLLIASGLLIRSLVQVRAVDPGFDTDSVLILRLPTAPSLDTHPRTSP